MAFGWKEGGRDWFYEPGEHMLMIDFDEADRVTRFEFQSASNWEDCEKIFSKWIQQTHQRLPLVMPAPVNAATIFRRQLGSAQQQFGNDSTNAANAKADLANELLKQGKFAEAEQLAREALVVQRKELGGDHLYVANTLGVLSSALRDQGKLAEAETARRENLAIRRKVLGNEDPRVATSLDALGSVLQREGKLAEAEESIRAALAIRQKISGDQGFQTSDTLNHLNEVLRLEGKTNPLAASRKPDLDSRELQPKESRIIRRQNHFLPRRWRWPKHGKRWPLKVTKPTGGN
jgi:tetratricopeptide (TPR) repeat protein